MSKSFNNWNDLKRTLQKEVKDALYEVTEKSYQDARNNTKGFYSGGTPGIYERTGKFGDSPAAKFPVGTGDEVSSEIYLDDNYEYDTGTYSARTVFEQAEVGGSGIKGLSGTWERTLEDIEDNIQKIFGKRFG